MQYFVPSISVIILYRLVSVSSGAVSITVATCNLWNVMFNWKTRVDYIASLIRKRDIDIVAFQEVRSTEKEGSQFTTSLLDEFQVYLPDYKWSAFAPAGSVTQQTYAYRTEWITEGLGILSRKQVVSSHIISMTRSSSVDKNPRVALQVEIRVGPNSQDVVHVIVVHFSYDRYQQCQNALDIMKSVTHAELKNVIVMGDFNVYPDFTGPIDIFTSSEKSFCPVVASDGLRVGSFVDAWLVHGKASSDGLTFSNMPTPGLQSRPDRILISRDNRVNLIMVEETERDGDGKDYRNNYYSSVLYARAKSLLKTSYDTVLGYEGYSCLHDCGPHGSCRCGVCISGGNKQNCYIPHCEECSGVKFVMFSIAVTSFVIFGTIMIYSLLRILVITSRFSQEDLFDILGYRCCLFNQQLFSFKVVPRKLKTRFARILRVCQLPPLTLLMYMMCCLSFTAVLFWFLFLDSINLIYAVLPEEMFPSDHLMVYSKLNL